MVPTIFEVLHIKEMSNNMAGTIMKVLTKKEQNFELCLEGEIGQVETRVDGPLFWQR